MEAVLEQILSELRELKEGQAVTNDRLSALEQGQSAMQARLDTMEAKQNTMEDSLDVLKKDMARHNHRTEPFMKTVTEGLAGLVERNRQIDRLERRTDDHGDRIWVLEQVVKP